MSDRSSERGSYVITPDSYIAIGNQQSQIGNDLGALAAYDRAVSLAPSYARAYNYRGTLKHQELGDPVGALADYDKAISLDPNLAAAYFVRSLLKRNLLDDVLGAAHDRHRAIEIDPNIVADR